MRRLLRPTLVKRMMLVLLLAFALVWLALMARALWQASDRAAFDANLRALGDNVLATIAPIDTPAEARAMVAATAAMINHSYRSNKVPGALLMELRDAHGARLFWSPEGGRHSVRATPGRIDDAWLDGQRYRLYQTGDARWRLLVAAPVMPTGWTIAMLSAGLNTDLLIAFPLVLLPLWLAVTRGLRPLRRLSEQLGTRGPDDLSALGARPRHAELQPLAKALDDVLARLRDKLARERAFVQDAAHELRTPMAVLSAQAHVLLLASDAHARGEAERLMQHAIARASHLTAQLLDLALLGERGAPELGELDVAQWLRHELAQLAPGALARHMELSLDAPDTLPCTLEVAALQSIVHNLLNNALAYVPDHGQICVTLAPRGAGLVLTVADDGPGIAADQRTRVFERFHRGGGGGTTPGAGLGLAIVREAAARLGGHVQLDLGIAGRGCAFTVSLPGPARPPRPSSAGCAQT